MTQTNDIELKKAALVIAKLLLRTREGRISWKDDNLPRQALHNYVKGSSPKSSSTSIRQSLKTISKQFSAGMRSSLASSCPAHLSRMSPQSLWRRFLEWVWPDSPTQMKYCLFR